jgi:hypothetical protein
MNATTVNRFTLVLSEEERTELLRLLEQSIKEARVEEHRTRTLGYREGVEHRRALLEGIDLKVRGCLPHGDIVQGDPAEAALPDSQM